MKFSIVIPLYNKAPYIQRALDSVLAQTVQDFEIIVVDDGSTDDGATLVRSYTDPRIGLIQQANAGVSAARNRGIAESRAGLIAFLDADDAWDKDFLEQISFLTEEYPAAGLFTTSYRMFDGFNTQYPQIKNLTIPPGGCGILINYLKVMLGYPPFYTCSAVASKEILQKVKGFPIGVTHGEDLDTWLRICLDAPIAFMYSHPVIYFTDLPASATDAWIPDDDFAPVCTAQNLLDSGLCEGQLVEDLQEYIAYYQLENAKRLVFHGRHDRARLHLSKIRKTKRYAFEKMSWVFWSFMPHIVAQTAFQTKALLRQLRNLLAQEAFGDR